MKCVRVLQVTREGKVVQSDVPRQLIYGTMVYVRQTIVSDASSALSRAVCIATRYSAVRRQFGSQKGGPETQVERLVFPSLVIVAMRSYSRGNLFMYEILYAVPLGLFNVISPAMARTMDMLSHLHVWMGGREIKWNE